MAESPNLKIATSAEHQGMEGENNWKQSWEEKWITATRKRGAVQKKSKQKIKAQAGGQRKDNDLIKTDQRLQIQLIGASKTPG
jgi:hypothetical protein